MCRPTNAACGLARGRAGFTRAEMLVVIAIVSTVTGLLTCMVAKVREASNRMKCQCHLKQLSLSVLNYESFRNHFPPGSVGAPPDENPNVTNQPNHGALTFLLPFVEQDSLYKQFVRYDGGPPVAGGMVFEDGPQRPKDWPTVTDNQSHALAPWWNNATNVRLAQTNVHVFVCPADNPYANTQFTSVCTIAGQNQFVNIVVPLDQGGAHLGRTNYIANAGAIGYTADPFYQKYVGPFTSRSATKPADFRDGMSNTIMFGETLGGESRGERTRAMSWMGAGAMPTAFGLPEKSYAWNFASNHTTVNFAMCDGSGWSRRRFDRDGRTPEFFTPAWYNLQRLGGMHDLEPVDEAAMNE